MGTLNPYRAPFLDGNWIIDTANTIGVNHFQLKLISEMFEMFVLLINEINLIAFALLHLFSFYLYAWISPTQRLLHTIFCIAYLRICCGNLPREFAAGICRGYLLQEFAVAICCENLPQEFAVGFFVFIREFFFVYVSKSCLYGGKPFICVQNL